MAAPKLSLSDLSSADRDALSRAHEIKLKGVKKENAKLRKLVMRAAAKYGLFFTNEAKTDIRKNAVGIAVYHSLEPLESMETWFTQDKQNQVAGAIGQARLKIWNKLRDAILTNDDEEVKKLKEVVISAVGNAGEEEYDDSNNRLMESRKHPDLHKEIMKLIRLVMSYVSFLQPLNFKQNLTLVIGVAIEAFIKAVIISVALEEEVTTSSTKFQEGFSTFLRGWYHRLLSEIHQERKDHPDADIYVGPVVEVVEEPQDISMLLLQENVPQLKHTGGVLEAAHSAGTNEQVQGNEGGASEDTSNDVPKDDIEIQEMEAELLKLDAMKKKRYLMTKIAAAKAKLNEDSGAEDYDSDDTDFEPIEDEQKIDDEDAEPTTPLVGKKKKKDRKRASQSDSKSARELRRKKTK